MFAIQSDFLQEKMPENESNETDEFKMAHAILKELMPFRRAAHSHTGDASSCFSCFAPHLPSVIAAIQHFKPITFVLPAFPGKSPSRSKVLGILPDMAERRALEFLAQLCDRIQNVYAPGAKIILCSDGRVFSDVVGMREVDVSAYQQELSRMIQNRSLTSISTFNLEDVFGLHHHFAEMRMGLMEKFGTSQEELKEKVRRGADLSACREDLEMTQIYRGITRFLFEDSLGQDQSKSRTAVQKEARLKAYHVLQRSNAWSELITAQFPEAVRLSIHPQLCGAKKFGIRLIGNESWMTPWHGVAVATEGGYILLKRAEAESLGAQLVCTVDGRPSHYTLNGNLSRVEGLA